MFVLKESYRNDDAASIDEFSNISDFFCPNLVVLTLDPLHHTYIELHIAFQQDEGHH